MNVTCTSLATGAIKRFASLAGSCLSAETIIHKEGDRLIVEPIREGELLALLASRLHLTEPAPDMLRNTSKNRPFNIALPVSKSPEGRAFT